MLLRLIGVDSFKIAWRQFTLLNKTKCIATSYFANFPFLEEPDLNK